MRFDPPVAAALLLTAACGRAAVPAQLPPRAAEPAPIEAGVPATPGEYDSSTDVLHYDVELALGGPEIQGLATVTVQTDGAGTLSLDLTGLAVETVLVNGRSSEFDYRAGKLKVPLARTDAETRVTVAYRGTPDDGLIIRENVHGTPSAFVDNWPNRTRFWLPSVDHPSDKATASFTVHAPAAWQVIANGAATGEPTATEASALGGGLDKLTWRWVTRVQHPTYTLVVGATEFGIESLGRAACGSSPASPDPDGCVEVSIWVYPQDLDFARRVFARSPAMVDYYTEFVGPYPFEKLAHVQSATRFGGMENSSAIFYSEEAIARGELGEGTVAHEIAHQWFGDSVTEADWGHLWLSEGFATYFGALFFEAADGSSAFRRRLEQSRQVYLRSDRTGRPVVDPAGTESLFDLLNANSYQKGGWVLHMLRGVLGDDTFFRGIRGYYERYAYATALTEDFQRVMEEVSGRPLAWFFDQWIFRPGYPRLESDWDFSPEAGQLTLTVRQIQPPGWPTFRLPMSVEVTTDAGPLIHPVELTERSQTFTIPLDTRPTAVRLDPGGWVLKG